MQSAKPIETILNDSELDLIHRYWNACNYLAAGMIYLQNNPLLHQPLQKEDIKNRLLGHWGASPALSFSYVHLNRMINKYDLNCIFIAGPGHGAPGVLAPIYLEGTYAEIYPDKAESLDGLQKFLKEFSFPGYIGSHCTPETPGSIHEGGELGYSLSHAYGAAFDNPDLIVACVVGDGEAETGPLATAWHSNKFLNPVKDGAVLPILNLNGYKIANPTILSRIDEQSLLQLFSGYGYDPIIVEGSDPNNMHQQMASAMEHSVNQIKTIQQAAKNTTQLKYTKWPMIILRTPKGWTGPKEVDGHKVEDTWRAHQVPLAQVKENPDHLALLEQWLKSYQPENLFDQNGQFSPELKALSPQNSRRMSANPIANGGLIRRPLTLPACAEFAVKVKQPGATEISNTSVLGQYLNQVFIDNPDNFRLFGPDETASNKLDAVYQTTQKTWLAQTKPEDEDGAYLAADGRVMEILSEHTLEGWLEGYLLTGRHGLLHTYEAFAHVIDSMINQHAKWLDICKHKVKWRAPISSLNILLSSVVWRQDHNGFSHQDPGFIDLVTNKSADVSRIYFPPDANCLLSVANHCLNSVNYINLIVADKQKHLQYLTMEQANEHCRKGLNIWNWASHPQATNSETQDVDIVLACCGDIPTMEALAAAAILKQELPKLKLRFINIVDLYRLQTEDEHPHGLNKTAFAKLFTADKPVIFNFHGYPWLIHKLAYKQCSSERLHVHGYIEKGNINTPLELAILNKIDRFNLVIDIINRLEAQTEQTIQLKQAMQQAIDAHLTHAHTYGMDCETMINWKWPEVNIRVQ
ncbi:phosphoketolase family protein [Catenovulum sp. 2E275]|uniref:phosphoketolase family protein n=1 Tax=Catenovulum sp. 2E275 TaxID=2980497 RepID=UPI0021CF31FF|nr:phosphoketolase family protein [Catenovulum sp. 2E275]MCU4674382.1 phosphoketolase family protein [Catenovulum sp. 2E275]